MRVCLISCLVSTLVGCGFQFPHEATDTLPAQIELLPKQVYSDFMQICRTQLSFMPVKKHTSEHPLRISVTEPIQQERTLAYDLNGHPSLTLLTMTVDACITWQGCEEVKHTFHAMREYVKHDDAILGNQIEAETIQEQLQVDLVQQLLTTVKAFQCTPLI